MRQLVTLNILYGLLGKVVFVSAQEAPEPPAPPAPQAPPAPPASQDRDLDDHNQDVGDVVDKHASCPEWAASGECIANPAYMQSTCSLSCASYLGVMAEPEDTGSSSGTCSPESIQDGTCSAPDASSSAPPTPGQPVDADGPPDHPQEGDPPPAEPTQVAREMAAAGESPGSERIPDAPGNMSQHAAGSDADSPMDPSRHAEGERSDQDPDTKTDGPIDVPPVVETPAPIHDPGQQAEGTSQDGTPDLSDGPLDTTQQHGGTDPELGSSVEHTGSDTNQPLDETPSTPPPSGTPPHDRASENPDVDSLNRDMGDMGDMGVPPPGEAPGQRAEDLPDFPNDHPDKHFEDDHHHDDHHYDHHDDHRNDHHDDQHDEEYAEYQRYHADEAARNHDMPTEMPPDIPDIPEAPQMPTSDERLHDEPPRRQEEARHHSSMASTPTLQAGEALQPPAPGLFHEAVTSQAPLFDKSVVIAVHKVVLSLSSGCFELSKEASELLSAALGGFLSLPAPLSTIAVAFLFFLVSLAFFRSLPTSFSAPVHEKSQAVKAAPVNSSPALSNDGLNALVKQVEALRQDVGSLSAKLHSVSTENANAMLQLRQEMHSMHQERNQTDEELLLSVKEILECLHGDVDGAELNHCHPHHESSTSQPTASTQGLASTSPAEPAPAANTSMSSAFAMPAMSSPGLAPMPNTQSSGASMPGQVPVVSSPVPAAVPPTQPSMPPAPAEVTAPVASPAPAPAPAPVPQAAAPPSMPFSAPMAAAPVASPTPAPVPTPVSETATPPSMPSSAPIQAAAAAPPAPVPAPQGQAPGPSMQAVPNTPPSAGPPPAVPQLAPTSPLEAAGDFGKRQQQQPIPASDNPFGARPQPKQPQASANPFGARPQPKVIAAVKGPFG